MTTSKTIRIHPLAASDLRQIARYIAQNSPDSAVRFLDSANAAFLRIQEQPGMGSTRYAKNKYIEGLRFWLIQGFESYLVFYIERPDVIDILRILHGARDIPEMLKEGLN